MKDFWFMRPFRIRGGCWRPANVVMPERLCMRDQRLTALAFSGRITRKIASRARNPHRPAMLVTPEAQSDTHSDWRLQPSLTTECILMHALCQPAALLAMPSFGRLGEFVCMHHPCISHASNRRGVTHQAIDGVERPSLCPGGHENPRRGFPSSKYFLLVNGFSRQFASFR